MKKKMGPVYTKQQLYTSSKLCSKDQCPHSNEKRLNNQQVSNDHKVAGTYMAWSVTILWLRGVGGWLRRMRCLLQGTSFFSRDLLRLLVLGLGVASHRWRGTARFARRCANGFQEVHHRRHELSVRILDLVIVRVLLKEPGEVPVVKLNGLNEITSTNSENCSSIIEIWNHRFVYCVHKTSNMLIGD